MNYYLLMHRALGITPPYDIATLRTDGISINPRQTSLQWATQLPGGFGSLSAGFESEWMVDRTMKRTAWLDRSVVCPPEGHIVLLSNSGAVLWQGRRTKPTYSAGRLDAIEGAGYGTSPLDDTPMTTVPSLITTTGSGVLRYVLSTLTPPIIPGSLSLFQDNGVPHSLQEFADQTPAQVVGALTSEGGQANNLFDFTVYGGRVAQFLPRIAPSQPDYLLPFDSTIGQWTEDDTQLFSTLKLTFTTPTTPAGAGIASYVEATNPTFAKTYGFTREKVLPGGTMTVLGAQQYVQTWLQLHGQPWISCRVTRDITRGLELYAGGAQRPAYYARAGEWAQVGSEPPLILISTTYQAHKESFECELGQPQGGFISAMQTVIATSNAVSRGINPVTGRAA